MAKRTVLVDTYNYQTPIKGRQGEYDHTSAFFGDEVDFSDDEIKRGESLIMQAGYGRGYPALGTKEQADEIAGHRADDLARARAARAEVEGLGDADVLAPEEPAPPAP